MLASSGTLGRIPHYLVVLFILMGFTLSWRAGAGTRDDVQLELEERLIATIEKYERCKTGVKNMILERDNLEGITEIQRAEEELQTARDDAKTFRSENTDIQEQLEEEESEIKKLKSEVANKNSLSGGQLNMMQEILPEGSEGKMLADAAWAEDGPSKHVTRSRAWPILLMEIDRFTKGVKGCKRTFRDTVRNAGREHVPAFKEVFPDA